MSGEESQHIDSGNTDERERRRLLAETEAQIRQHAAYRYWDERLKAEERIDSARKGHPLVPDKGELDRCREQAERGDSEAMCRLADIYRKTGQPGTETSLQWMHRAAEAGNPTAMFFLAQRHDYLGSMLKRREDQVKALEWYVRAAEMGRADAMDRLGWLYLCGQGVERDCSEAMEWFRRAAEAGNVNAMDVLASAYERGIGVAPAYGKAICWYRRAAHGGHSDARKRLQKLGELI
jgi:TPR repeat protein